MFSDRFKWAGKRPDQASGPADLPPPKGGEQAVPSKAFPKFLSAVSNQPEPTTVIDFGPVIGGNVEFLGDRLGCKLFIEDLIADVDRHQKSGSMESLGAAIELRLRHDPGTVDGILCWDLFDFLDKAAAQIVARHVVKMIRPGGAIMGFFCTSNVERAPFTKFEIVDDKTLRHRQHSGGAKKYALQNRDIIKMFDGLIVSESFLLKSSTREILLRKR